AVKRRFLRAGLVGEKVGGIQRIVAQKFECRTMKFIRAALGYDADLAACAASEFRSRNAGLNRELLHRVGDSEITQCRIDLCIDVTHTVEQEDIRLRTRATHVETAALRSTG